MSSCKITDTKRFQKQFKRKGKLWISVFLVKMDHFHTLTHCFSGPKLNKIFCDIFILWQIYFSSNTHLRRYKTDSLWSASSHSIENFSWLLQWCDLYTRFSLNYREHIINYTHFLTHFVFILQGKVISFIYIRESKVTVGKTQTCVYTQS